MHSIKFFDTKISLAIIALFLKNLLDYLEIDLSPNKFDILYDEHAFENLSKGRGQGEEDINSHYRKGKAGDWKEYFDDAVMAHFARVTGNLLNVLEYTTE